MNAAVPVTSTRVVRTDPQIAETGFSRARVAEQAGVDHVGEAKARVAPERPGDSPRSMLNLLFDARTGQLYGATVVASGAGGLAGELAAYHERGEDVRSLRGLLRPPSALSRALSRAVADAGAKLASCGAAVEQEGPA